jgi:hypothetical protein
MITASNNLKYFSKNTVIAPEALAKQLNTDLADKIEHIYEAVEKANFGPSNVLLQSTSNSLRHSVEQIHLEEDRPFFKNDGQCRGASEWFIALFLNFKKKYPEVPTHKLLVEIAKEFEEGVGIQGACLQKSAQEDHEHQKIIHSLNFDLEKKSEWELRNKDVCTEILKNVYELEDGVYLLSFPGYKADKVEESIPGHATVIIVENGNYYFFDPNVGLAGTGRELGTEDKINDIAFFLTMCKQYSPFNRAEALFQKGLKDLSQVIGTKEAKIIQEIAPEFRKGRACLSAYAVGAIFEGFKNRDRIFSKEEREQVLLSLCINPGLLQVKLEMSEALRLNKCIFLETEKI